MRNSKSVMQSIRFGVVNSIKLSILSTVCLPIFASAFNNLNITNRAQCAIDSELPTQSAFVIIDSYNAMKMANNIANSQNSIVKKVDKSALVGKSAKEFRLAVTHVTLNVMKKLLTGKLPILPANVIDPSRSLATYSYLVKQCADKSFCPNLQDYLEKIWNASLITDVLARDRVFYSIDTFREQHFFPSIYMENFNANDRMLQCYYLKKFSPLQAQLQNNKSDLKVLSSIALAYLDQQKYITDCYSQDSELANDNAAIQIDINSNEKIWNEYGFNFWNSVKIYTSWAWRNSNILKEMSPTFYRLFKSIAIEESMMLLPNGCKSLTSPKCDLNTLSENSIRELAKRQTDNRDHFKYNPEGADVTIQKQEPPAVNTDILSTLSEETASDWVARFREQFVAARGLSKNKLQLSLQRLGIIQHELSLNQLIKGINSVFNSAKQNKSVDKKQLYYLCQEFRLAADPRLNFIKSDIDLVLNSKILERANQVQSRNWPEMRNQFNQLSEKLTPICDEAAKLRLTEIPGGDLDAKLFRPWAQEILYEKVIDPKRNDSYDLSTRKPLILWSPRAGIVEGNILCFDEVDCVRTELEAYVDLNSSAKYAAAFLPIKTEIGSASVFNPYSELKACKIYDPWLVTKQAQSNLISDMLSAILFGWSPAPIRIDTRKEMPKVASLNKLLKDGYISFDPKMTEAKRDVSLMADFGPMAGVPCQVSYSNANQPVLPTQYYNIASLSVNYCSGKTKIESVAKGTGDVTTGDPQRNSMCGGCTINLVTAESTAAFYTGAGVTPIKFGISLFRAISNFVSANKDQVNIPQQYQVNPEYAAITYKQYGSIPENCVNQLNQGLLCYSDLCSARAAKVFEQKTGIRPTKVISGLQNQAMQSIVNSSQSNDESQRNAYITIPGCHGEISVPMNCKNNSDINDQYLVQLSLATSTSKDCRQFISNNREKFK